MKSEGKGPHIWSHLTYFGSCPWLPLAAFPKRVLIMSNLVGHEVWQGPRLKWWGSRTHCLKVFQNLICYSVIWFRAEEMEHISKQIFPWLLTHANSWTKFRCVIKHLVIFEATLIDQIRCPKEARGWFISVFLLVFSTLGFYLKKRIGSEVSVTQLWG